jgi:hypothetical protein
MYKLISFLWAGCWHRWEPVSVRRLTDPYGGIGTRYIARCAKCGTMKWWDVL